MSVHMPKRSVTRFFVPLIDVLLLLFCIFLLMPMADEEKLNNAAETIGELSGEAAFARAEVERREIDLQKYAEYYPELKNIEQLKTQIKEYPKYIHPIDIDGKTGNITYYDRSKPSGTAAVLIANEEIARKLIDKHAEEADGDKQKLYYLFLYPRPRPRTFPNGEQEEKLEEYKKWFHDVANSLKESYP